MLVGTANTRERGTLYRINVRSSRPVTVLRSLDDFKALHASVGRSTAVRPLPSLPIGGMLSSMLSSRRDPLSRMDPLNVYLHALLSSDHFSALPAVRRFLEPDDEPSAHRPAAPSMDIGRRRQPVRASPAVRSF